MPIKFLKIIATILLFSLVTVTPIQFIQTVNAQEAPTQTNENDAEERVKILRNLGAFFSTFFSTGNSFQFFADDIFIKNQCQRRDITALQSAKTGISDYMLDNYTTITLEELEIQKTLYASLATEVVFLRNLDMLQDPETKLFTPTSQQLAEHKELVFDRSNETIQEGFNDLYPFLLDRYRAKFEDYENCENIWTGVVRKSEAVVKNAREIAEAARNFKDQFLDLGQTFLSTPEMFAVNSTQAVRNSFVNSYQNTVAGFREDVDMFADEFRVFSEFRNDIIEQRIREQERIVGTAQSLGQSIVSSNSLTEIPSIISDSVANSQARSDFVTQQAQFSVVGTFTDTGNLIFIQKMIDANNELVTANNLLTQDQVGVVDLLRKIGKTQCSDRI